MTITIACCWAYMFFLIGVLSGNLSGGFGFLVTFGATSVAGAVFLLDLDVV